MILVLEDDGCCMDTESLCNRWSLELDGWHDRGLAHPGRGKNEKMDSQERKSNAVGAGELNW